jgi:hypothetical protein
MSASFIQTSVMANCDKILTKAQSSPNNLSFGDLCDLAECFGWVYRRRSGSHRIYENVDLTPDDGRIQNFQEFRGKAKPYQVRQLLKAIAKLDDAD